MRFRKLKAELSVTVFETEVAHLANMFVAYLSFGCQKAAALALQMRNHTLSIFTLRIYIALPISIFGVWKCAGHILEESHCTTAEMRAYIIRGLPRRIVDSIERLAIRIFFENGRIKL